MAGGYDGSKRDPQHSGAASSSLWEVAALARHFPRLSLFENTGAIFTNETHELEAEHELA